MKHMSLNVIQRHYLWAIALLFMLAGCGKAVNVLPTLARLPTQAPAANATVVPDVLAADAAAETAVAAPAQETLEAEDGAAITALETEIVAPPEVQATLSGAQPPAAETPEVFQPVQNIRFRTENGDLFVVASRTTEGADIPILPEPPEGQRWFVITATLGNRTGTPFTITHDSLTLIDQQQERYAPVENEDVLRPPLVDSVLGDPTTTLLGVVRFAIPADARPHLLEWCPDGDCSNPLQATIPN